MVLRWLAVSAVLLAAGPAHADDPADPPASEPAVGAGRRVLATVFAAGPGVLVRGGGSWIVHENRIARRLALTSAIGLGGVVVGGLPIFLSGGNPYSIVAVPVLVGGFGIFMSSWWADIAIAAGGGRLRQLPRAAPPWSVEVGTVWERDPYRQRGLMLAASRVELGRVGVGVSTLVDAENRARDGNLETSVRLAGAPATGAPIADGSRAYVRSALRAHRDDDDRVTIVTGEVEIGGRLDLVHIDDVLRGTFFGLSTGVGFDRASYVGLHDTSSVLLGTFAWGLYLGRRGEATVFYDHRRDSLVGGLGALRADGFVGSFGTSVDVLFAPHWAVRGQLEYGNALVTTFAVRFEGGPR